MKKLSFLVVAMMTTMAMNAAVDWSGIAFLGNGSGNPVNDNMYKCTCIEGTVQEIVNIQAPGWASEAGIYVACPSGITSCTLGDKCKIEGAGILLYLSAFTAKETELTITFATGTAKLAVFYANGTGEGGGEEEGGEEQGGGEEGGDVEPADWKDIAWLEDGAEGGALRETYKIKCADGQQVANIQKAPWADNQTGIYTWFPAAIESCSLPEGSYAVQGGGILLFISAFTEQETTITITCADGKTYTTVVFYKNGKTVPTSLNELMPDASMTNGKYMMNGQVFIMHNGVKYTINGVQL